MLYASVKCVVLHPHAIWLLALVYSSVYRQCISAYRECQMLR